MSGRLRACIVGAHGALGSVVTARFKAARWHTVGLDITPSAEAHESIVLTAGATLDAQLKQVMDTLKTEPKVDAIICAAGGWAGGSAGADPTAFAKSVQDMVSQCLLPPMLATSMAAHLMNDGGALVIVGSAAALRPTPGMIAYGAVKAATHHIVHSAAAEGSGLPKGSRVLGIIPTTIDTPSNRKWMAGADMSTWTSTADIADKVLSFAQRTEAPPVSSGSLLEPVTFSSRTVWHEHSLA